MTVQQILIKYSESFVQLLTTLRFRRDLFGLPISLAGQKDAKDRLWLIQRYQNIDSRRRTRLSVKPSYQSVNEARRYGLDNFVGCRKSGHLLKKNYLFVPHFNLHRICMIHTACSKCQKMGAKGTNSELIEVSNRHTKSIKRKDKNGRKGKVLTECSSINISDEEKRSRKNHVNIEEKKDVINRMCLLDQGLALKSVTGCQDLNEYSVNTWSKEDNSFNSDESDTDLVENPQNMMNKAQATPSDYFTNDTNKDLIEEMSVSLAETKSGLNKVFSFNMDNTDGRKENVNIKNEDEDNLFDDFRASNDISAESFKKTVSNTPGIDNEKETDNILAEETVIRNNVNTDVEYKDITIKHTGRITEPNEVEVSPVNGEIIDLMDQDAKSRIEEDEISKKNKSRKRSSHLEKSDLAQPVETKLSQMILDLSNYPIQRRIMEFFEDKGLPMVESYTGYYIVCPKYGKVAMRRKKEEQSIYVNYLTGDFKCISCGKTGNWNQLKDNITHILLKKGQKKAMIECFENVLGPGTSIDTEIAIDKVQELLDEAKDLSKVDAEEFENILSLFDWQGISKYSLKKYRVKYMQQGNRYTIYFPIVSIDKKLTGARVYTAVITEDEDVKLEPVYTIPRFTNGELFGWQTRPDPDNKNFYSKLVITFGEIQAMAVTQGTTLTAVSIRNIDNFPQEHVPTLEKFEKIYLWLGTDLKSWEMSKFIARKLNEKRCLIFRPANVNEMPLECIQMEQDIRETLKLARPLCHEAIHSFHHLRLDVYREFYHHEHVTGVKWKRYDKLNNILKGFRQGELTVLTGPTGSGKTTFLSDYSLDLCMQGVKTLWGSFEICNVRLIKMMMQQFSGINLTKYLDDFDEVADNFTELPMFYMAYHGQQNVEMVLETMCHAVYVHNIQHIIIDNLQFMVGMERFEDHAANIFFRQDQIVSKFRKFATDNNCHVTLIIHPRKIDKGEELSIASIFGSAKVSQESDNILLIQDNRLTKPGGRKYLQIVKNRFDGDLGVMVLAFNKDSLCFTMNEKKKAIPTT